MNGNTMKKKLMSLVLVTAMVLTSIGLMTMNNAAYAAENEITVYVTVSNAGELAADAEGDYMVNMPVTVSADAAGLATVDAALAAFHAEYYPGGYETSESAYGLAVNKLWGIENGGSYLFAIDGVGCSSGVGYDLIGDGQHLTAIVMKDLVYWSDLVASFDQTAVSVMAGEEVELTLSYDAVTYDENWNAAHVAAPVGGANVFVAGAADEILGVTDENGKAVVSFAEAGTYVVAASGAVTMQVQDWAQGGAFVDADAPISAVACVITVEAEDDQLDEDGSDEGTAGTEDEKDEQGAQEEEPVVEEEPADKDEPVEEPADEEPVDEDTEKAPATGDASQMAVYLILMMAAAGTAFVVKKQK